MTATSTAPITPFAAQALARIASRTRVRLVRRGISVQTPAEHAQHLVSLLARVPEDYSNESVLYAVQVQQEFAKRYVHLRGVASIRGAR